MTPANCPNEKALEGNWLCFSPGLGTPLLAPSLLLGQFHSHMTLDPKAGQVVHSQVGPTGRGGDQGDCSRRQACGPSLARQTTQNLLSSRITPVAYSELATPGPPPGPLSGSLL